MGCCCSKTSTASGSVSLAERAGQAGSVAGGAVAGAAIGSAITGPAAPVGAIVGGIVGAALGVASAGTVGAAVKATQSTTAGFLKDTWRVLVNRKEVLELLPDVGVLRTERPFYPPAMSEITSANKYLYENRPALVKGLTYLDALEGVTLSAEQEASLRAAVAELDAKGVLAITADCSAMVAYQPLVAQMTSTPVVLSSLLQAPLLMTMYKADEKVLVLTSDSTTTTEGKLAASLLKCGVAQADLPRFVLKGCQDIDGFRTAQLAGQESGAIDAEATAAQLLAIVREAESSGGGVRAVLLESTMLPMFADVIRAETPLAVFDNITLVDLLHKAATDNPRFGITFAPSEMPQVRFGKEEMPSVGILRIDYTYPPAMGDAAHAGSYYYRTPHAVIKGLSFEAAQAGKPLTEEQRASMQAAISELEEKGVQGIAGDCGFLVNYQREATRMSTKVPCFISAMLQAPLLPSLFGGSDDVFLVLTASGPALLPALPDILAECHVAAKDIGRFVVRGCEDLPGFEAVAQAKKVDVDKVRPHVVKLVSDFRAAHPGLRAVLLECTELPPYADAIRHATGLLVLDAITLVDFFHSAVSENPYFGIDWERIASTPEQK